MLPERQRSRVPLPSASKQPTSARPLDHTRDSNEDGEVSRRQISDSIMKNTDVFSWLRSQWHVTTDTETRISLLEALGTLPLKVVDDSIEFDQGWSGWLRCQWEIPEVMRQIHASSEDKSVAHIRSCLEDFATITGGKDNMVFSTCAEFLEKTWNLAGLKALDRVSEGVAQVLFGSSQSFRDATTIHATTSHLNTLISAEETDSVSFFDAVVWICTAVRTLPQDHNDEPHSGLQISEAIPNLHIEGTLQPGVLVYSIQPLYKCPEGFVGVQSRCWTQLFTSGIIAFRQSERAWGYGLEISFDRMLHLCAVENSYHLDGGIVLHGFFTALVPISYDKPNKSIQWHFESVEESCGDFLSPRDLLSTQQDWFKTTDLSLLRASRCFVGWFEHSNIMLGTRTLLEHQQHCLQRSVDTHEHAQSAVRAGYELGAQLSFSSGPVSFQANFAKTWKYRSHVHRFDPPTQYVQAVGLTRNKVALVLDSESKQAWLVPMLSLILHLCHIYTMDSSTSGSTSSRLPFAAPCHDGSSAAKTVLERNGHLIVSGRADQTDGETLRQLFLRINTNMLTSTQTGRSSDSKRIFASELSDLIHQPARGSPVKEVKIHECDVSWSALADKADFVGVCANLGQVIQPVPPTNIPICDCRTLPRDKYLLAAHIASLERLAGPRSKSIYGTAFEPWNFGEKAQWSHCSAHFIKCDGDAHQSMWDNTAEAEKVVQIITTRKKGKEKEAATASVNLAAKAIPESGVVVFGGVGRNKRSSLKQPWTQTYG